MADLEEIKNQVSQAILEVIEAHPMKAGSIFVIGCSSSEIAGGVIGHASNEDIGKAVFQAANAVCQEKGLFLAAQCCEHLNRALVISTDCAEKYGYEVVNVVPWLKGGGSFATAAYHGFDSPAVVEHIKAAAGLDIGSTLIGMHLKDVAVPLRLKENHIGNAYVTAAYTRPKYIGGERAKYL
ncbi:MAG: TIGR01440 family protein [Treponema sp.]|nr:TIGR01440 family protein [Treponema sp.]